MCRRRGTSWVGARGYVPPEFQPHRPVPGRVRLRDHRVPAARARTANDSATYADSGNPCVDLFFEAVPNTRAERVRDLVAAAWARDPLTALKLVANLRGVRGTGKSDREGFYAAALWMHDHHPRTLACNVPALAAFGYLKDFPELLYRLIHGAQVRKVARARVDADKARKKVRVMLAARVARFRGGRVGAAALVTSKAKGRSARGRKAAAVETDQDAMEEEEDNVIAKNKKEEEVIPKNKEEKKVIVAKNKVETKKAAKLAVQSLETYYGDSGYRFLFDCIADLFASLLASDLEHLAPGGKRRKIGLAAKWCPTPGSSFDRSTLLCEAVARRLFPRDSPSNRDYAGLPEEHYAYRALHRLRREMLVPLRKVLQLPETYMSAGRWHALPYARVVSVAMRRYKALFKKHDEARFRKYLEDVEAGKAKIAALAYQGEDDAVAELQWRRMVDDLRAKGALRNCVAVCDVSGSPWSSRPEIHEIRGETLREKMRFVKTMDWGANTNFQAVFDRILERAVGARLAPEKMVRTVFVFSDMELDQAGGRRWETDYQLICRKFREAGYGDVVPQIVFWNLADSKTTPVTSTQPGVALVSGFSKNLMKLFLENDGLVNPEVVMAAAIAGDEYQKLVVFD
ncbi:hypothetical protein PR202_ga14907 [Eleusine coracana subsp. coracana]|uniref:Uncharacterized protein n=1 Tax=Eleusine coracana subsp. coracana TaxID=191504 RepID=A0AAV5CHP3_ELECO|nr:hypothetical protein PR202_ga14907 [Eleusine coracana subsp. coracana]